MTRPVYTSAGPCYVKKTERRTKNDQRQQRSNRGENQPVQCGPLHVEIIMGHPIIDSFFAWSHLSLCHKEPAKGNKSPSRGLWVPWAGSLWHKRSGVASLSTPREWSRYRVDHTGENTFRTKQKWSKTGPISLPLPDNIIVGHIMFMMTARNWWAFNLLKQTSN